MSLEDYQAPTPHIESVHEYWIEAYVADDIPRPGEALGIVSPDGDRVYAEVRALTGARRVQAILPSMPSWLEPGLPVERTRKPVAFDTPTTGDLELRPTLLQPDGERGVTLHSERPSMMELDGERPFVATGIEGIDLFSPVAGHGLNLVIDVNREVDTFGLLAERVAGSVSAAVTIVVGTDLPSPDGNARRVVYEGTGPIHLMALRLGMRWAAHLRDQGQTVFVVAELPRPAPSGESRPPASASPSFGDVIDLMGSSLVSTRTGRITTLLRLPMEAHQEGLAHIIETMDLGAVDSQIFLSEDGRYEPSRSFSRADVDSERQAEAMGLLSRAHRVKEKIALFGEFDLEEGDLEVLERMRELGDL
ncbi:MAG: hypothetical protein ACNA8W_04065 [Bradymonadaceae bacterium]